MISSLAISCLHLATPATMAQLHGVVDYPLDQLRNLAKDYDRLILLGDTVESLYDTVDDLDQIYGTYMRELHSNVVVILGNHDSTATSLYKLWFPNAPIGTAFRLDGITYLHGHLIAPPNDGRVVPRDEYLQSIRVGIKPYAPIVYGHTHEPLLGADAMDVGSVTYSRTYGIVRDRLLALGSLGEE